MVGSALAKILGVTLFFYASSVLAAPIESTGKLVEGRAVYEAQVSFGGARETELGAGFDFGVPPRAEHGEVGTKIAR
jgi:hypothetical protein